MAKKIKKYKVGLDSETYKISMVSEPAIEVDYVALAKQDEFITSTPIINSVNEDLSETLNLIYE